MIVSLVGVQLSKGGAGRGTYQFAAMMGLPSGLARFLDFGFNLILGIEERFFFFWSSRPMMAVCETYGGVLECRPAHQELFSIKIFCIETSGIQVVPEQRISRDIGN